MSNALAIDPQPATGELWGCASGYNERRDSIALRFSSRPDAILKMPAAHRGAKKVFVSFQDCTANDSLMSAVWANATAASSQHRPDLKAVWVDDASNRRVERLTNIQSAFGVSTQLFAQMLGISRAQLYKWMDPHRAIDLQQGSMKRLATLERLANIWSAISRAPVQSVLDEPHAGGTLRELLIAQTLDEARIEEALSAVPKALAARPQTLSQRMRAAGFQSRRVSIPPDDE